MEDCADVLQFQRVDEARPRFERRQQQVVHVRVVRAVRRYDRTPQHPLGFQWRGPLVVAVPQRHPPTHDVVGLLQLRGEEGSDDLAGQVRRADIHPCVLVDLPAEELAAVGTFLADDLRAFHQRFVVDQQRAAFARDHILGLVEAQRAQRAERPQRLAAIGREDSLRGVLDHGEAVALRDRHDRVHLAAHARVVDDADRLRARSDRGFDQRFVDVERVPADVDEHRHRAAQDERVGGRHEGERRHDDFVARLQVEQERAHFQRRRARVRQQRLAATGARLQPRVALPGEPAVSRQMTRGVGLADQPQFAAGHVGLVEGNFHPWFRCVRGCRPGIRG